MNAIIGVGQFCEIHGPCLVFCTQTVFKNNNESIDEFELDEENQNSFGINCDGCSSIGIGQALMTENDQSSNVFYISTQTPRKKQLRQYLKKACVRSLSCEIGGNSKSEDECTMCFCDADRGGHTVLCYTWRVPDAQARGFRRWLTIVLLMKDRFMLMSVWPFFIKNVKKLVTYLQNEAKNVYSIEEKNGNNRAARLQSGRAPSCAPRSLAHLSGLPTVWSLLHTRFSWILHSAPNVLSDTSPPQYIPVIDIDIGNVSFRELYNKLTPERFLELCHCASTGTQVILRGNENEGALFIRLISALLPPGQALASHGITYLPPNECPLLAVSFAVALPKPSADVFRIDMLPEKWVVKWEQTPPEKYNNLVVSIMKAVINEKINPSTLKAHVESLVLKWQNITRTLALAGTDSLNNKVLLRTLGIGDEDLPMVTYWLSLLQTINSR